MAEEEAAAMIQSQAEILKLTSGFVNSMALRCAVELGIADIINTHSVPITISQIAQGINSPTLDINFLSRVLRLLARRNIFTAQTPDEGGDIDTLYGLNHASKWLLRDAEISMAPLVLMQTDQALVSPCQYVSTCVKEGGNGFPRVHGMEIWEYMSRNPVLSEIFNTAMACTAKLAVAAILKNYRDGFDGVSSLVDVGGGTGKLIGEIVKAHPHVRGINFDLPHVVAAAPEYPGVVHVEGDMFVEIPQADCAIMKTILHDWADEDCVRILKNCHKAISTKEGGKLILVEVVLKPDGVGTFDEIGLLIDFRMMALTSGGKERTEADWKKLLNDAGFPSYKIIEIPNYVSIIEAYPE